MAGFSIKSDVAAAGRILPQLSRGKIRTAARQAINRTATTVRKEAMADLIEDVQPRVKGTVNKQAAIEKAKGQILNARIVITDRSLALDQVKQVRVRSFRKGNRRVQKVVWRGREIKGAFRPTNLVKGNKAIFKQVRGKYATGNRKVKRLYAYPILQEFLKNDVESTMEKTAAKRWPIEFTRAINNQLRRLARRQAAQ